MFSKLYNNINFLNKSLNGVYKRNEAISNNIANVNTAGYKRMTVDFESELKASINNRNVNMNVTDEKHISKYKSAENTVKIKRQNNYSTRNDENNVNIDVEMADLTKNTVMYNALINQVSNEFNKIKMVINEGR